ncbi:MAG TPA: hypothetical protein VFI96_02485 [Longimicrobiaceae bacterium]|nr:hypothetical protein [Longimicrobiaceae bacterium]
MQHRSPRRGALMRAAVTLLLSGVAFTACESATDAILLPSAQASLSRSGTGGGPEVSGHTNFTFAPGFFQTTSFHARTAADGSVSGSVELNVHREAHDFARGTVACVVVNGNEAILAGPVTDSNFGATAFWIRVRDNGEGAKAPADEWSDFIFYLEPVADPAALCDVIAAEQMLPIEGGNVQVRS